MSRFIFTFAVYFLIWMGFTTSFDPQELIAGAVLSLIITFFSYKSFTDLGLSFLNPKRLFNIVKYMFVFIIALFKANFDVAKRVINPKLPINPGIVAYKTKLKSDTAKVFLANSITLTPGTLTVDVIGDTLYIHWIDVITKDPQKIYSEIGEQFEVILKEIFE
ncbi:MAG: Na+/H+ antiporter subunit E [Chlorobi bacterium]|nr:Na+/H+ antiporter subunit E [Chlorobiota bacterium]